MIAYINIGTNLGNRAANIDRAISAIEHRFACKATRSDVVESEPWGFVSQNRFMNIGIRIDVELSPFELLDGLQAIERKISPMSHRTESGGYADRVIDIDIMDIDGVELSTPRLTVPHAHLREREFFMVPYRQLKSHGTSV